MIGGSQTPVETAKQFAAEFRSALSEFEKIISGGQFSALFGSRESIFIVGAMGNAGFPRNIRNGVHPFYDPFPTVEHYEVV
jgi:hypothetical protein